jgi:hypothetical protein
MRELVAAGMGGSYDGHTGMRDLFADWREAWEGMDIIPKLRRLELTAGAERGKVKPGIWATNKALGKAERELGQQAEIAYRRLVADWQAQRKRKGAGVPVGRDSSSHLLAEETAARQDTAPDPAL